MMTSSQQAQWHNAANQQNGVTLPVLHPKLEGYEVAELHQWEMCVQMLVHGVSENPPVAEIGNKVKYMILHLEEIHGKNKFMLYSEHEKRVQVATFPKMNAA
eukprot:5481150-Ditylum_brightwellii.AAC.1